MRPIKFRAWDKDKKQMLIVDDLDGLRTGNPIVCVSSNMDGTLPLESLGRIPIMQFTGLLDKNGKEVYEGDIVECQIRNRMTHKGEVLWDQGSAMFRIQFINENGGISWSAYRSDLKCKVIGNIYENPELLEAE